MEPLRPEHADKTTPVPGARRFEVRRVLAGYAYPVHDSPQPHYHWRLLLDGQVVDQDDHKGPLISAARKPHAIRRYTR